MGNYGFALIPDDDMKQHRHASKRKPTIFLQLSISRLVQGKFVEIQIQHMHRFLHADADTHTCHATIHSFVSNTLIAIR